MTEGGPETALWRGADGGTPSTDRRAALPATRAGALDPLPAEPRKRPDVTAMPMHIVISNSSKEPIYEQIKRQIKECILRGELKENEPLPSIRQLAKDLHISVITTKRAYDDLKREGFLVSVVGKGTFVAGQNRELLREMRLRWIEYRLAEVVAESKALNVTLPELTEMLQLLYEETPIAEQA